MQKKRTHREETSDPAKKGPPKSFVWAHGSKRALVRDLCADMRQVMQPHTAVNLRVSQRNVLKDFVHVAGPLGVTHFVVLTATDKASYLKLCKSPRVRSALACFAAVLPTHMRQDQGPTAVLKILEYSLIRDVQASLKHPRAPHAAFLQPPLVVLQGFAAAQQMKLTAVLFQNMFPAINVSHAKLSECQRVVLLVHNKEADTISLRHFCISVTASGLTKGVKALVNGKRPPDLSRYHDVADFVERAGYASESEGEDAAASRVQLNGRPNGAKTSRVKLHEIGPRLELQLVKVQEGLAEGRVLYHRFEQRAAADVATQELELAEAARLKAERRREQEENIRRKAHEQARVAAAQRAEHERKEAKRKREEDKGAAGSGKLPKRRKGAKKQWWEEGDDGADAEADDDVAAYTHEVGEAPDEHFGALAASGAGKQTGHKPWGREPGAAGAAQGGQQRRGRASSIGAGQTDAAPTDAISGGQRARGSNKHKSGDNRHGRGRGSGGSRGRGGRHQ